MKLYGNLVNRLEEGQTVPEIKPGTDITMYYYSDRTCYFVTRVIDQKHIFVKRYEVVADRDKEGGIGHQNWLYFKSVKDCNKYLQKYGLGTDKEVFENSEQEWVFRYNHWYEVYRKDVFNRKPLPKPLYHRISEGLSFGKRDYYYDWEF